MLGKREDQRGLFEADQLFLELVGRDSFYGQLAALRDQLFRDEEFADLYCQDNGRTSKPPSLMATALLLQAHDKVSDAEARRRATVDMSWKVALGVDAYAQPFAQRTLQHFRAQLILHEKMRAIFVRSLELARERGLLQSRALQAVLDTTPILGRDEGIDLYFLPPYSPELNDIEPYFGRVKHQEMPIRSYTSTKKLIQTIHAAFRRVETDLITRQTSMPTA